MALSFILVLRVKCSDLPFRSYKPSKLVCFGLYSFFSSSHFNLLKQFPLRGNCLKMFKGGPSPPFYAHICYIIQVKVHEQILVVTNYELRSSLQVHVGSFEDIWFHEETAFTSPQYIKARVVQVSPSAPESSYCRSA